MCDVSKKQSVKSCAIVWVPASIHFQRGPNCGMGLLQKSDCLGMIGCGMLQVDTYYVFHFLTLLEIENGSIVCCNN